MRLAVLQPGYLPWLGFFDQLQRADCFIFYDDVQYDKNGWRNRNRIKSTTGEPHWLTVPGPRLQQILGWAQGVQLVPHGPVAQLPSVFGPHPFPHWPLQQW